jgi:predicted  nucleic acid-binding Zn-ribbon protein
MQAATLGADLVFVRDEVKDDPRVLREELIHTQQQAAGVSVDLSSTANAEIEARELMIENQARWGITDDEVAEMKRDITLIQERGRY